MKKLQTINLEDAIVKDNIDPSFCIKLTWKFDLYVDGVDVKSIANFEDEFCDLACKYFDCRTIEIVKFNVKPFNVKNNET